MKKSIWTLFLIFFLGGAYYTGTWNKKDEYEKNIKDKKQELDSLKIVNEQLHGRLKVLEDGILMLSDSLKQVNLQVNSGKQE